MSNIKKQMIFTYSKWIKQAENNRKIIRNFFLYHLIIYKGFLSFSMGLLIQSAILCPLVPQAKQPSTYFFDNSFIKNHLVVPFFRTQYIYFPVIGSFPVPPGPIFPSTQPNLILFPTH